MFVSFFASRMKDFLRQLLIFFFDRMFMIGITALKLKSPFVEFFTFPGCFSQVRFFAKVAVPH